MATRLMIAMMPIIASAASNTVVMASYAPQTMNTSTIERSSTRFTLLSIFR